MGVNSDDSSEMKGHDTGTIIFVMNHGRQIRLVKLKPRHRPSVRTSENQKMKLLINNLCK